MLTSLSPRNWFRNKNSAKTNSTMYPIVKEMSNFIDRFNEEFDKGGFASTIDMDQLDMKLDLVETDNKVIVSVEVPGLSPNDINVSVKDNHLIISGEKKEEKHDNVKGWYHMERSYGSFYRTINLDFVPDENSLEAHLKNGVLKIEIPKTTVNSKDIKKIKVNTD